MTMPHAEGRPWLPTGVLLAAGAGRRMGGGKLLRRWPDRDGDVPLVVATARVLHRVCETTVVVSAASPEGERVRAELDAWTAANHSSPGDSAGGDLNGGDVAGGFQHVLGDSDAPMFHSILAGFAAALAVRPSASILMHLGDVPCVSRLTVDAVLVAASGLSAVQRVAAVMPEYQGRGGHPVHVPSALAERIAVLPHDLPGGLRQWWDAHPEATHRLPVDDAGCRMDLDTPGDWEVGVAAWKVGNTCTR
ncbi:MAG: NTP transferase domain-containing protein [Phycisphaerales bacterium]